MKVILIIIGIEIGTIIGLSLMILGRYLNSKKGKYKDYERKYK